MSEELVRAPSTASSEGLSDPFLINGPALISFSGGRSSAYMLWRIVQAHGGALPQDVVVAYANTGKEREETLRFVHECATRWGVYVEWLERRTGGTVERVGYNSASRNGEPLSQLFAEKKFLPNAVARFCTGDDKIGAITTFLRSLGWTEWLNVVGFRADETKRVHRRWAAEAADDWKEPYRSEFPMFAAGVSKAAVEEFWSEQDFDLGIPSYDGNCDGCFLKSAKRLMWTERTRPGTLEWWAAQEEAIGGRFVTEYSYRELINRVRSEPLLPGIMDDADDERDVECGFACAPRAA